MDELKTLIFRTDRIGDFIISCPFILSYKKKFNKTKIVTISSEYNYDYIKNFKFIDEIIPLKNEVKFFPKLFNLIKMIFLLRKNKFDHIIVLDGKNRSFFISLFLSGKKSILLQSRELELFSKFFRYISVINYELQNQLKNFSFLASKLNFDLNLKYIDIYKDYHFQNKISFDKKYLMIHLDEKWYTKFYYRDFTDINPNPAQLEKLVNNILNSTNFEFDIILTTGSKKLDILDQFTKDFTLIEKNFYEKKKDKNSIFFIKETSFNDLEYLVKHSSFLICCEGGISHVSHNFKVSTVAFYEKNRLQHTKYWTGHMTKLSLYERKEMHDLIEDKKFYNLISDKINLKN